MNVFTLVVLKLTLFSFFQLWIFLIVSATICVLH